VAEDSVGSVTDAAGDLSEAREIIRRLRNERDRLAFERDAAEIGCRQQLMAFCRIAAERRAEQGDIVDAIAWLDKLVAIAKEAQKHPRLAVKELDPAEDERRLALMRFLQRSHAAELPFSGGRSGRRILITTVACNRWEAEILSRVLWPCLLAKGNLPALAKRGEIIYQVFTTAFLKPFLSRSPSFQHMHQFCNIQFMLFPGEIVAGLPAGGQYREEMALLGARHARTARADLLVLLPDMLISDQVLETVAQSAEDGAEVVLTVLPGLDAGLLVPLLQQWAEKNEDLPLDAGSLADAALQHLGEGTLAHVASADNERYFPKYLQLIWQGEDGLVFHAAEQHPLFLAQGALSGIEALQWTRFGADLVGKLLREPFSAAHLNKSLDTCGVYLLEQPAALPAAPSVFHPFSFAERFWRRSGRFEQWMFEQPVYLRGNHKIPYVTLSKAELANQHRLLVDALRAYNPVAAAAAGPLLTVTPKAALPDLSTVSSAQPVGVPIVFGEPRFVGVSRTESGFLKLDPGLYALNIAKTAGSSGDLGDIGEPAIQICAIAADGLDPAEIITEPPTSQLWACGGSTVMLKSPPGGGCIMITGDGYPSATLAIDIQRVDPAANAIALPTSRETRARQIKIEIMAHIENFGDRSFSDPGWCGVLDSRIEGFSIRPLERISVFDIEYKAIWPNDRETPWMSGVELCGTRGQSLPLIGFAVRLRLNPRDRYEVVYEGKFFKFGAIGPTRNGELCRSPIANDPLGAINIRVIEKLIDRAVVSND